MTPEMSAISPRVELDENDYTIHSVDAIYVGEFASWDGVSLQLNEEREYVLEPKQALYLGYRLLLGGLRQFLRAKLGFIEPCGIASEVEDGEAA